MSPSQEPRERRRLSFGANAEQYDRARPGYPVAMVKDVIAYAGARPGDRCLEVGAGTGKATLLFAAQGLEVTSVEPDPGMASVAADRATLAGLTVEFINADFESAFDQPGLPEHAFRLLFCGTAWHWVKPELRNRLAARALVAGGALAPFWNRPSWPGNPLREPLQRVYDAIEREHGVMPDGPMNPSGQPVEFKDHADWTEHEFAGTDLFTDVEVRRYDNPRHYTAQQYVEVIGTHSDHQTLEPGVREQLLDGVRQAIEAHGGGFELGYQTLLCLARRA